MDSLANLWLPCVVGLGACALVVLMVAKPWERRASRGRSDDAPEKPPRDPDAS